MTNHRLGLYQDIKLLFSLIIGLLAYSIIGLFPQGAYAQSPAITASPSIVQLDLAKDAPETTLTYTNTTSQTISLTLSASDVTELEDGYKLSFIQGKDAKNYRYTLSSWIHFDKQTLLLKPHEADTVKVTIEKDKLTPGGHYGSILASIENTEKAQVTIHATLATLIFVRTNTGKETESGTIDKLQVSQQGFGFPESAFIRFNNSGDVDVIPYGLIEVQDMFGNFVAKGILNESSLQTLPESIRRYDIPLKKTGAFLFPGMYRATLHLHFGKKNIQQTYETRFFSEGSIPLIPLLLMFVLGVGGFFFRKSALAKRQPS